MRHLIIGTAGHVDHGKTALIGALTGINTDRLKEERERGISIELGFASLTLPSGIRAGIVDVPGHERFIHHMLAGAGGMDMVLLVVAADEGIMPQTREHMDIIGLLNIKRGVVALTKADLVDDQWIDMVAEEIQDYLKGTKLAGTPVVPVSSASGQGLAELLAELDRVAALLPERDASGSFRLNVDRVFSVTGFGTVVTGTLISGRVRLNDPVEVLPGEILSRVRSLQVHGEKVEEAEAGQRVAVNISGVEVEQVPRGSVIAAPGTVTPASRLDARLVLLKHAPHPLKNRTRLRIHLGTAEVLGRVRLLDRDELKAGEEALVQLELEEKVACKRGDLFVARSYSPMHTAGGGNVIEAGTKRYRRFRPEIMEQLATRERGTPEELVRQYLAGLKSPAEPEKISTGTGLPQAVVNEVLSRLVGEGKAVSLEGYFWTGENLEEKGRALEKILNSYHKEFPFREGIQREEVRSRLFKDLSGKLFTLVLQALVQKGVVASTAKCLLLPGFIPAGDRRELVDGVSSFFAEKGLLPPGWGEIKEKYTLNDFAGAELLQYLLREGILVKIAEDLYLHRATLDEARLKVASHLKEKGEITVGALRDLLGTSRRIALPLLEYFDRERLTKRVGDLRLPGRALD